MDKPEKLVLDNPDLPPNLWLLDPRWATNVRAALHLHHKSAG